MESPPSDYILQKTTDVESLLSSEVAALRSAPQNAVLACTVERAESGGAQSTKFVANALGHDGIQVRAPGELVSNESCFIIRSSVLGPRGDELKGGVPCAYDAPFQLTLTVTLLYPHLPPTVRFAQEGQLAHLLLMDDGTPLPGCLAFSTPRGLSHGKLPPPTVLLYAAQPPTR